MTGIEFCEILGIDYDAIVSIRRDDTADNFAYVVEKMVEIYEVRKSVLDKHREHIAVNEFYEAESDED
ncbi:MAG: hypothetical protein LUE15_06610 [Oscillospiraceae bacterium]|nr:hypothetical protein [Oscillospiraceae bacterium]